MRERKKKNHLKTSQTSLSKDKTEPELPIDQVPLSCLKVPWQLLSSKGDSYCNPQKNFLCRAGLGPAAPKMGWEEIGTTSSSLPIPWKGLERELTWRESALNAAMAKHNHCPTPENRLSTRANQEGTQTPPSLLRWCCGADPGTNVVPAPVPQSSHGTAVALSLTLVFHSLAEEQ